MNFGCTNGYKGEYDSLSFGYNGYNHFYGSNANVIADGSFYVPSSFTAVPAERFNPTMDISVYYNEARSKAMANLNQSLSSSSTILPPLMTYDAALLPGLDPDRCRFLYDQGAGTSDKSVLVKNNLKSVTYDAALLPGLDPDRCRFLYDQGAGASDKSVPVKNNGNKAGKKSNGVKKGQWTAEEDGLLASLVNTYGMRKWFQIAQMLGGRIGKQCRERWHNHLKPNIKKDKWNEEEDRILIEAHSEIGNRWAEIAKRIPGRTENSIKNHWNATKRKQFTQRRRRMTSKHPNPSTLLQEYIKSLGVAVATPTPEVLPATSNSKSNVVVGDAYDVEQLFDELGHGGGTAGGGTGGNGWTATEHWDGATPCVVPAPVTSWESLKREMDLMGMAQNCRFV